MKRNAASEFIYQLISLLLSVILVHALYVTKIRPEAEAIMAKQQAQQEAGSLVTDQRSLYLVLKDYEQETCLILMLWALMIMGYKARLTMLERDMFAKTMIKVKEGTSILPEDARKLCRPLQELPEDKQSMLAPRTLLISLKRFATTSSVAAVATAIKDICDSEADRLDSELSMVRYITWAIPSIGFIGTVRGIGDALGQAHKAVEGDIVGVTSSLGVAFNSTFIALVISIFIMFFTHQLQLMQERLVQNTQEFCDSNLLNHLKVQSHG
ncbi:MotA/TolQ/ExbB proton channel family protein [Thalassotalea aquiviva]|uniref:MotA/TolQ/ExbB proton channel family protein n=1 Tax=Thalassotalea aquiviva TaxID=3242415 RepID=UPI003529E29C